MLVLSLLSASDISAQSQSTLKTVATQLPSSNWQHLKVQKGDNLSILFKRAGLSAQDVLQVSNATKKARTFVRMIPGEKLSLLMSDGYLTQIHYQISKDTKVVLIREPNTNNFLSSMESVTSDFAEKADRNSAVTANLAFKETTASLIDTIQAQAKQRTIINVKAGADLESIFAQVGLNKKDILNILNASLDIEYFEKIHAGDSFDFLIVDNALASLIYTKDNQQTHAFTRLATGNDYSLASSVLKSTTETSPLAELPPSSLASLLEQQSSATDQWIYYNVQSGDNLSSIFIRAGLSYTDVHYVNLATDDKKIFKRLMTGEKLAFLIREGQLIKVKYIINRLKNVLITRQSKTLYQYLIFERTPITKELLVSGTIQNSLYIDALNAGLTGNRIMNFVKVFSWDVDFSQDLQPGDKFKVVYEQLTIDGSNINGGNIVAAQFHTGGQNLIGIFYRDSLGGVGFYSPDGRSLRKNFLRMPIEFARISSKFNLRRKHPILNTIRAHKGVDYAAKRGTPIMASGNGKIIFRGRKGGFGNTVIIQHGGEISTLYAHLSGFNKEFKTGSRVQQGQVIGYVGSTGAATGPHLHYEFRVNGVHKNPLTVKLKKSSSLEPKELARFMQVAKKALAKLNLKSEEVIASKTANPNI